MPRAATTPRRKPRLRTELSEADERRLAEAVKLFGLPKAEVVRRLIRASVQAGPALSAENTKAVVALAGQVRMVGRAKRSSSGSVARPGADIGHRPRRDSTVANPESLR